MKKILFVAAVAALFCSCSKDETTVNPNSKGERVYREFTAEMATISRAHLGEPNTEAKTIGVYLDAGDQVLFVNENKEAATAEVVKVDNGVAYIAGEVPAGTLTAYYPAWAYDNDRRNYWDISQTDSQYGTLNIDKYQFAHEAVGKMDHLVDSNANKNDEWRANSLPIAMIGSIVENHVSFAADANAAILEIPVKGDVLLQKICLYYTDKILEPNGAAKTAPNHELHFINEQLTSEAKSFYIMVKPGDAKYIVVEFQTSTEPESAKALNLLNGTQVPGKDELDWYNGRCFGYRYMRRVASKSYAVKGVTTMPTTDLTASQLDENRYIVHLGSANQSKNYGVKEGTPTAADFKGLSNGNVVKQFEEYVEVEVKPTSTPAAGSDCTWRGDFGIATESGHPENDKVLMPVDAGNYRYLAVKTDVRVLTQNTANYWTASGTKGNLQLWLGFEYMADKSKVYYEKWSSRDCKTESSFSYLKTDEDGVEVLVFDLMARWNNFSNWLPTTRKVDLHNFKFVVADMKRAMVESDFDAEGKCTFANPTYKVYWMGYFTSIDEISQFMKNN
ncbi:MAG: hypothetical protein IJN55_08435 [Alistipes sp.]|nr:hypothetical protein [Alistipes sp.]